MDSVGALTIVTSDSGVRTLAFAFVSEAFVGLVWQLWVGVALFLLTQVLMLLAPSMPNSPAVFHLLPVGVPRFLLVLLVSLGLATMATLLVGDGPDSSRWAFVFLLLPGLVLAGMGMFGREPAPGDVRWYQLPNMRLAYRIGGVVLVAGGIGFAGRVAEADQGVHDLPRF